MRTWGREKRDDGTMGPWREVTETNLVWLATLVQTLRLNQGESPFYGDYGIPAQASITSQIAPDAAVARTQSQYLPYFASLAIAAVAGADQPTYSVLAVMKDGTILPPKVVT